MYFAQLLFEPFTGLFILDQSRVLFEPWRLITAVFLHGSFEHLIFNMLGLFFFAPILEEYVGSRKFLYLYFGAGLFASIVAALFYPFALGASGALFGVLGAIIVLMPTLRVYFFFVIPMPIWVAGIVWAAFDTLGLFYPSGIASAAHLAGMALGLAFGYYIKRTRPQPVFLNDPRLQDPRIR